ncbi:MAG TPA: hypothetical protein VII94_04620 [Candidatus Saccharimonadales bacterium]
MKSEQDAQNKLMELVLEDAADSEYGAGMNGSHHDGGASVLKMQVEYYRYGRDGITPPDWNKYLKELDPEYQEYLRLKAKFG